MKQLRITPTPQPDAVVMRVTNININVESGGVQVTFKRRDGKPEPPENGLTYSHIDPRGDFLERVHTALVSLRGGVVEDVPEPVAQPRDDAEEPEDEPEE